MIKKYGDTVEAKAIKEGEMPEWFKPASTSAPANDDAEPNTELADQEDKDDQENR